MLYRRVKRRNLKRFVRIFYPFFETLDTFGCFLCSTEPKKRFCKKGFCRRVKRRTLKRFCRIFYPFFETLDTFGCFQKSTEPFRRVLQNSFFFSECPEYHASRHDP